MGLLPGHKRGGHSGLLSPGTMVGEMEAGLQILLFLMFFFFFNRHQKLIVLFHLAMLWGLWNLRSPIRDWTQVLSSGPNHWPTREFLSSRLLTWTVWPKTHLSWNFGWLDVSNGLCTCCILVHATWLILWVNVVAFPCNAKLHDILSILAEKIGQKKGGMTGSTIDFWHMSQTNTEENTL